ncbi:MAG: mechanosensitive ion channel family protein [Akkermansia sp.]|nr:mechanosensitive ion channel family protein [Akkermansia sp.]
MDWMEQSKIIWAHMATHGWIELIVYLALGWILCTVVGRVFTGLENTKRLPTQMLKLLSRALKGIICAIALIQGLRALGIDVVSILGAAGVMGVAIGFASQTSLSNLISGIFLISERSFKIGDYIRVEGEEGTVESINLLSVFLRRPDNALVRIPCESLIKNPVTNITGSPRRRIDLDVGVDYSSDLRKVKEVILDVIKQESELMDDPAPVVMFTGFGDSSLNLRIGAWCKTEVYHGLRYRFATALLERFAKEGINIPFPIRTVLQQQSPPQQTPTE